MIIVEITQSDHAVDTFTAFLMSQPWLFGSCSSVFCHRSTVVCVPSPVQLPLASPRPHERDRLHPDMYVLFVSCLRFWAVIGNDLMKPKRNPILIFCDDHQTELFNPEIVPLIATRVCPCLILVLTHSRAVFAGAQALRHGSDPCGVFGWLGARAESWEEQH
jgi:hypothetical protein